MPIYGLGTFNALSGLPSTLRAIKYAIRERHIRLIDSSEIHGNELDIGLAINTSNVARHNIFVVSKLYDTKLGKQGAIDTIERSLKIMNLDYIDQYLINFATGGKVLECYDVLLEYKMRGVIKTIGVANFGVKHLEILKHSGRPLPQVNQIELHPWCRHESIVKWCRANDVVLVACCPLTRGNQLSHPFVIEMAQKYDCTPAQILIRWSLQSGFITIPKTTKISRIEENSNVFNFEISAEDMSHFSMENPKRYGFLCDPTNFDISQFGPII